MGTAPVIFMVEQAFDAAPQRHAYGLVTSMKSISPLEKPVQESRRHREHAFQKGDAGDASGALSIEL